MKNNIINNLLLTALAFTVLVGCRSDENTRFSWDAEAVELPQSLTSMQKLLKLGSQTGLLGEKTANKQNKDAVEPISFQELLNYLPKAPAGWTAAKPKGEKNSLGDYSISQVSQTYTNGDKKITVGIFDWSIDSALPLPFLLANEFSRESTEGYNKGIEIDGVPGRAEYTYDSRRGSLNLLVDNSFLVQINGTNIDESELRDWWQLIDLQSSSKISEPTSDRFSNLDL